MDRPHPILGRQLFDQLGDLFGRIAEQRGEHHAGRRIDVDELHVGAQVAKQRGAIRRGDVTPEVHYANARQYLVHARPARVRWRQFTEDALTARHPTRGVASRDGGNADTRPRRGVHRTTGHVDMAL